MDLPLKIPGEGVSPADGRTSAGKARKAAESILAPGIFNGRFFCGNTQENTPPLHITGNTGS